MRTIVSLPLVYLLPYLVSSYVVPYLTPPPPSHTSVNPITTNRRGLALRAKKYDDLKKSKALQLKVDKYIRMRDLRKDANATEDFLTALDDDEIAKNKAKGYQKFVGKGTLDQRLRAIIAYKREGAASDAAWSAGAGFTSDDEAELEAVMNDDEYMDDDNDELPEDDIDLIYEREITKILQNNALNDLQRGMLADKVMLNSTEGSIEQDDGKEKEKEEVASKKTFNESDMYTPTRSAWGVFPRPKDISKAYGGGRVITREEVRAADREWEMEKIKEEQRARSIAQEATKREGDNKEKLSSALSRGRRCMQLGDRVGAVKQLEAVQEYANIQSELGGEVLLELAMAYETVERVEDARALYGKLLSQSVNSKTRRNALGLIQGLDIVSRLRKDITRDTTPLMDYESMQSISMQLREGLRNEWDDYKKRDIKSSRAWYDENDDNAKRLEQVQTVSDAYYLALRAMNPLKKIPSESLRKMFRRMYLANDTSKIAFVNNGAQRRLNTSDHLTRSFYTALNGSWELVMALADTAPYAAKRFETGAVRILALNKDLTFIETVPSLWGMFGSLARYSTFIWDSSRREITVVTPEGRSESKIPSPSRADQQVFQVTFIDDELLMTRQAGKIGQSDMFILWRRVKPTVWKKY